MAFTYFWRDWQTLDLVMEHVLPDLKRRRYINVWDAGCAMGPESYTLAIMFRENMGHFMFRNMRIYATDIDESNQFGTEQTQKLPAGTEHLFKQVTSTAQLFQKV